MLDAATFAVKAIKPQGRSTTMPDSAWVQAMEMYDGTSRLIKFRPLLTPFASQGYWKRAFHAKYVRYCYIIIDGRYGPNGYITRDKVEYRRHWACRRRYHT